MSTQETIADAKLARRAREDELARDILDECRVQLMLKFRFLDMPFGAWKTCRFVRGRGIR